MVRQQLDERQWVRVAAFLESERGAGRPPKNNRNFIEAVLWWRRTGVPWRDLPDEFGPWKTVFNRFDRWSKQGRWNRLFQAVRIDVDDEWHSIDATINRAHQHAAGGKGGPNATPSASREADRRRKSTSSLMRSDYPSTSR
jgi:putative transposase